MINTAVYIDVPPPQLWLILTDFESWKEWNTMSKDLRRLETTTPPALNTQLSFTPTMDGVPALACLVWLTTWEPEKEFAWKGGPLPAFMSLLSCGHHWFRLKPSGKGTLFEHGEEIQGLSKYLISKSMLTTLETALNTYNKSLKQYAESRPPP